MRRNVARYVEFVYWVAVASTGILTVLGVSAFLFADGLLSLKYALFVVGFLLFGVGSFAIQPSPRGRGPLSRLFALDLGGDSLLGFEQRLEALPPLSGTPIPLERRVSRNVKLFVTSLVLLAVSFALEVGLGVGPG
ncbi:MAG: hypothetical protein ABEI98_01260 [Halorhabdus sp.]